MVVTDAKTNTCGPQMYLLLKVDWFRAFSDGGPLLKMCFCHGPSTVFGLSLEYRLSISRVATGHQWYSDHCLRTIGVEELHGVNLSVYFILWKVIILLQCIKIVKPLSNYEGSMANL